MKKEDEMLYVLQEIADSVHCLLDVIVVSGVYKKLDDELRDRLGDSFDMICDAEEKLEELMSNDKS